MEKFTQYYSASVSGTGNNNGINLKGDTEYVFKSYYKLRVKGKQRFKLFFVNEVESTGNCRMGKMGDAYTVTAYAAMSYDKEKEEGIVPITFAGAYTKDVQPGEQYSSDEFEFTYDSDGYLTLVFKINTTGRAFLPATNESASTGRIFENGNEIWSDNFALRPAFVGVKKDKKKTVAFLGDSITQGTRTGVDQYEAWTHRIGNSLEEDVSFWNLGMGWSRAYDAASDGTFLKKAAMCDEVFVCFGVNDIRSGGRLAEEVIADLKKIQELLLKRNQNIVVHFLTVPPFNMSVFEETQRKKVNEFVKNTTAFFDIAACLECDMVGSVIEEYMVNRDDAHPNGEGGRAVYEGFMAWREQAKW